MVCNLTLTVNLVRFAKENPGAAEWVKARVPPETWARLDDLSELVVGEGHPWFGSLDDA
jgi:hypothetical protein